MNNNQTFLSSQALYSAGKITEAKNGFLALLKEFPHNAEVLQMLALIAAEEADWQSASKYIESAIDNEPQNPAYRLHAANILKAQQKFDQAIDVLKKLMQDFPSFAAAYNNLGTIYFAQEKWSQSIQQFQTAIDLQPNYGDAYYNLSLAYIKNQQTMAAENVLQSLLALNDQHVGAHFQMGKIYMQQEKYKNAIKHFLQIISQYPFHFETQVNLGTCYLRLHEFANAQKYYLLAQEMMPHDEQVLFNLGVIAAQYANLDQAIHYYLATIKQNPQHFDAHNNLGIAYLTKQDKKNALHHFEVAANIQPHNEAIQHTVRILSGDTTMTCSPPEYIRQLFDSYADHYEEHLKKILHYQVPKQLFAIVKPYLTSQMKILDLGCGTGLCGELFKPYASRMIGVDLSQQMLLKADQKKIYQELIANDFMHYFSQSNETFDFIVAGDVIVYFGDLQELFTGIVAHLNHNGLFLFNTEINQGNNFTMTSSGRFAHKKEYIEMLATQMELSLLVCETHAMRTQYHAEVNGHFYLFQKK